MRSRRTVNRLPLSFSYGDPYNSDKKVKQEAYYYEGSSRDSITIF